MNQNFMFMKKLVPKILAKQKWITNRAWSKYRSKCDIGDIMHCFTGMRTKHCQKVCDAKVVDRAYWEIEQIPPRRFKYIKSPLSKYVWSSFALIDGFDTWEDFVQYFINKRYDNGILCYQFEIIETK